MKDRLGMMGFLLCLLILGGCLETAPLDLTGPGKATLQGTVTIGPLCPVEPCQMPPEQVAQIYQMRKVFVYREPTHEKVAEQHLSAEGTFMITLEPGEYLVDISDAQGQALPLDGARRPMLGNTVPQKVVLNAGETVSIHFDIDTGIR